MWPETAVVTVVHGRHDHLRRQRSGLLASTTTPRHVVVAMADPEVPDVVAEAALPGEVVGIEASPIGLPLAAARNLGAKVALEAGAEVLVFLDVDCVAAPDLVAAYRVAALRERRTIWSGPVTYLPATVREPELRDLGRLDDPHPVRPAPPPGEVLRGADPDLFWSLSFAVHRDAWRASGGFCEEYVGYGGEDTDFAAGAAQRGLDFAWLGSARAYHQWHPVQSPPVGHVDDIVRNARLFHRRWGRWPMSGWLEDLARLGLVTCTDDGWHRVSHDR